jgi:hypothetical protein
MRTISERFEHLYKVISSPSFLRMEGQGGEIPFFISTYDPKQELEVRKAITSLRKKLENSGVQVLEIDLFDLSCAILEEKSGMERLLQVERSRPKDKFLNALRSSLNIHEVLMPRIKAMVDTSDAKVYFLTGIGAVFPFIRSHNVLNNLQNIAKDAPTVAFFPGEYDGHSLNLFGLLKDDNYYRAFNIESTKV